MAAPQIIQSKARWHQLLEDARRRTDEKLALDPGRSLLNVVRAQLDFMEECTQDGRSPTEEEAERIFLAAAHRLESALDDLGAQ